MRRANALHYCELALCVAAVYFFAAKMGFHLAEVAEQVTLVWAPAGISLAAVILFGYRIWPGIALGALAANAVLVDQPFLVACGIAAGNTLEAVIGAWLLRRFAGFHPSLSRFRLAGIQLRDTALKQTHELPLLRSRREDQPHTRPILSTSYL